MTVLTKLVSNDKPEDDVIFISYNSTGFNIQRADFITNLISVLGENKCLVSLQEHFLMSRSIGLIEKLLPDNLCIFFVEAFKDSDIRRGRGKGGLSMIWPKCIDNIISRIPLKSTKRVQACMINFPRSKILWVNSYFPTDPHAASFDDSELREVLAAIKGVTQTVMMSSCREISTQIFVETPNM
jgi:hypothetical protein